MCDCVNTQPNHKQHKADRKQPTPFPENTPIKRMFFKNTNQSVDKKLCSYVE